MRIFLLSLLALFVFSCSTNSTTGYHISKTYDEIDKSHIVSEVNNTLESRNGLRLQIYLSKDIVNGYISLNIFLMSNKWWFLDETNTLQILFQDGEILKLSANQILREVLDSRLYSEFLGVDVVEFGSIYLKQEEIDKLINKEIKTIRIECKNDKDYSDESVGIVQNRWREFFKLYYSKSQ